VNTLSNPKTSYYVNDFKKSTLYSLMANNTVHYIVHYIDVGNQANNYKGMLLRK